MMEEDGTQTPPETDTPDAQIIDFTSAALERRLADYLRDGNEHEASIIAALLEGYELGMWDVEWRHGEPYFSAPDTIGGPAKAIENGKVSDEWLHELMRLTGGALIEDDDGAL
jgi:hypothetical protein